MKKYILFFFAVSSFLSLKTFSQEWAEGVVWYQIFPERFANGDSSNDPEPEKVFINSNSIPADWQIKKWTGNWFKQDEWEKKLGGIFRDHLYERRYGGDLQGIINKLDYLKDLGVGAIYLNPVFEAASLHKYDGSTYHHIDVNFGPDPLNDRNIIESENPNDPQSWKWTAADKLFLKLIDEVHKRGMKIIIDGVFNHTGTQFWAFKDVIKNGEKSDYKDWYIIHSFDDPTTVIDEFDYKGWWGVKSLPELNRTDNDLHPGPKQYIFHSTKRWMDPNGDGNPSDGIDGWRLDVAREVPPGFWNDWSKLVKSINKDALIVGELWELSPDFISEDGPFDALMNYNFAFAVNDYIIAENNSISTDDFISKLKEIEIAYPKKNLNLLQNLLDSHDTDRLSSMIKNPGRKYDRDANESNPNYNPGKPTEEEYNFQKLIAAFQFLYQGSPMIYYGDEVGMWGADDPHCRKPMLWDDLNYDDEVIDNKSGFSKGFGSYTVEQNKDLLNFYKKIISVRNNSSAIKKGSLKFLFVDKNKKFFVFKRELNNELYIAAVNFSSKNVSNDVKLDYDSFNFTELINGESGAYVGEKETSILPLQLSAQSVKVYKIKR